MRIFVANIAFTTTEDELERLFEPYGSVDRVQIITDRDTAARGALPLSRCLMPHRPKRPLLASTGRRWGDGR
jgi:RNA recognition motif-containing protein